MPTTYREGKVIVHDGANPPDEAEQPKPVEPVEPDEPEPEKPVKPVKVPAKKGHR